MTGWVEPIASARFCRQGRLKRPARRWQARLRIGETKRMSEKSFVAVASLAELPPGTKKVVEANGIEIVLCHTSTDKVFAVQNLCSHAYEKLDCGRMRGGWLSCPVHGARFDLETGMPLNPPASMPIQTYEVRIDGDTIAVAV
jgi:3-phenylpropionate/trans-cinnamate dioxygenase ferredoxin component